MENEKWQEGDSEKRPQRPRFTRVERAYSANGNSGEHAFRPQGFESHVDDEHQQSGYRQSNYNQGSYNRQGDKSSQSGYNRQSNYNQGSYNRQGDQSNNQGGYNRQGSYNQGGYNRQGDQSNNQGGYNRQGSYNQGGYNRQGDQSSQGGYNRPGGYNQGGYNRPGGYNQGGYNRPGGQGGYNRPGGQGGYNRPGGQGMFRPHSSDYDPNAKYSLKKQIEYKEYLEDPNAPIRLNKYLANAGVCSRREADEFIQAGVVRVNNQVVTELGTKVQRTDEVHFHDQLVSLEKKVYVLLNKPKDYVTTSDDPQARKTVMELVQNCCRERIYPVGRLDRNTTGVLLFTNDGELASKLTHPKFLKKKIYHVYLDKNCATSDMHQIAEGVTLEDGPVHADAISYASDIDRKQIGIEIHSGKNRIVRRIFESLGYHVLKLDRVVFAGLTKKGLKRGDWRFLTEQEVAMLHMNTQD